MKFLPLFDLHLTHPYYTQGRCPDFQIEPTLDTHRLLNNYRCVLKPRPNGVRVFTAVTDQGAPFISMVEGAIFAFHLRLQNPDFALFTDLTELTQTAAPLYTNAGLSPGDPVQLALLSPCARLEKGVFADLEIRHNDSLPEIADGPGEFHVTFKTKQARWKYYVIADKVNGKFRIEDRDASPLVFGDKNRTDLNRHPDASDDVAVALAEQYPDLQRFRFVSDGSIPCRQAPRKNLQLYLNGNRIYGPLPNPALRNNTTTEIKVNRTLKQEDAFFHTIKYVAHPSPKMGG